MLKLSWETWRGFMKWRAMRLTRLCCGTDFGTQTSSFCSEPTFRDLYYPYYKQVNDWIHRNTSWKTFKHSCGRCGDLFPR